MLQLVNKGEMKNRTPFRVYILDCWHLSKSALLVIDWFSLSLSLSGYFFFFLERSLLYRFVEFYLLNKWIFWLKWVNFNSIPRIKLMKIVKVRRSIIYFHKKGINLRWNVQMKTTLQNCANKVQSIWLCFGIYDFCHQ